MIWIYSFLRLFPRRSGVLATTPDLLPVLKEAAWWTLGGQGLVEVLRGAYDAFQGKEIDYTFAEAKGAPVKASAQTEAEIKFGYCTEFLIMLDKTFDAKTESEFKAFLESIGDSIVCVADDDIVKIHVHTNHPGQAIERALELGSLSRLKIDNMREEHEEKLIKEASKIAASRQRRRRMSLVRRWALSLYPSARASVRSLRAWAWTT